MHSFFHFPFLCDSLFLDQNDLNRSGSSYLGKLRSNFVGTEFQVFDDGVNPKESEGDDITGASKCLSYHCHLC
jgi:hypothetical protein